MFSPEATVASRIERKNAMRSGLNSRVAGSTGEVIVFTFYILYFLK